MIQERDFLIHFKMQKFQIISPFVTNLERGDIQSKRYRRLLPVFRSNTRFFRSTFSEIVLNEKMKKATTMLLTSNLSIEKISFACEYANPENFIRKEGIRLVLAKQ